VGDRHFLHKSLPTAQGGFCCLSGSPGCDATGPTLAQPECREEVEGRAEVREQTLGVRPRDDYCSDDRMLASTKLFAK
jgi:hypothetical protein